MTQITENGQLKSSYTFDATNMMTGAFARNKGNAEYSYNGFKNRIKKLENLQNLQGLQNIQSDTNAVNIANVPDPCSEVKYVLDMTRPYDNLLATKGVSGQGQVNDQCQNFVWGNSVLFASQSTSTGSSHNPDSHDSFYYLHDHLSSPIRLLGNEGSDNGNDNNHIFAYDEFGVPEVGGNRPAHGFENPFGFTGYQTDNIAEMYYAQARYYAPTIGRFGAEDPIKDRLNWYGYCEANPVALIDPSGLAARNYDNGLPRYENLQLWVNLWNSIGFIDVSTFVDYNTPDLTVVLFVNDQMGAASRNFIVGENGTHLVNGSKYVRRADLNDAFRPCLKIHDDCTI